ncbi:hypothetical protein HAX54_024607 [Datura stramonium]|uniref:Galectin n=1 Tax=Datura stramonium TaxID=4076 RepID=A0ABS8RG55_DATST|nr:hypothetical protein [Datura stramonium]
MRNNLTFTQNPSNNKVLHFIVNQNWNLDFLLLCVPQQPCTTKNPKLSRPTYLDTHYSEPFFMLIGFPEAQNEGHTFTLVIPVDETINHVFINGELAKKVGRKIATPLGVQIRDFNIQNMMRNWWNLSIPLYLLFYPVE